MSGPPSILFAILCLFVSTTSTQRFAYGLLAAFLGMFSAYRVWLREHNDKLTASLETEQVKRRYLDEIPRLGFRATIVSGSPELGQIQAASLNVEFLFHHLSGRPATSIGVEPITSHGGNFTLYLDPLPYIAAGQEQTVRFEVWRHGQRPSRKLLNALGWGKMLADFLWDSRVDGNCAAFPMAVRFQDRGEHREQRFRLLFDRTAYRFDVVDDICNTKMHDMSLLLRAAANA